MRGSHRFPAVLLEDGSTSTLPESLKQVWRGCGGSGPQAALKLRVRSYLLKGGLRGPSVQAGRSHETPSPLREQQMPRGSWWVGDLGDFWRLGVGQLVKQGVDFLLGDKEPLTLWKASGQQVDVLDLLPMEGQSVVDVPVV